MTWAVSADVERFDEALEWFLGRTILTDEQRRAIPASARARSFWIAGVAQLDVVQDVFDELDKAITAGEPFEEFQKRVRDKLTKAWGRDNPARIETIFRNAAQSSYNAGRWAQMTEPSVAKFRPYFMYDAILDDATTPICKGLNGTILHHEDPFWDTHWPPLHHRCRSSIRNLRRTEAERRGITTTRPDAPVPEGWGLSPRVAQHKEWRPEPGSRDQVLLAELEKKLPPPPPPPKPKSLGEFPKGDPPRVTHPHGDFYAAVQENEKRIPKKVKSLIRDYSSNDYGYIRDAVRMAKSEWMLEHTGATKSYEHYRRIAQDLAKGVQDFGGVAGTPSTIHRGIRVTREVAERFANTSVLTVDAVASATHNAGVAIRFTQPQYRHPERDTRVIFNLKLRSERGTLPIDSFSAHQGEHEILLGSGKRFKVTSVHVTDYIGDTMVIIDAEEMGALEIVDPSREISLHLGQR